MTISRDSQAPHNPIVGEIRDWYIAGKQIGGRIYGHAAIKDGTTIYSEQIKDVKEKAEYVIAISYSGRHYLCYKNQHHPTKKDVDLDSRKLVD